MKASSVTPANSSTATQDLAVYSSEPLQVRRIGDALVDAAVITEDDLDEALKYQAEWGGRLGRILISLNKVTRRELYQTLADCWGLELIDLITDPCDSELLAASSPEQLVTEHWVPHHRELVNGKTVLVCATAELTSSALQEKIAAQYGVTSVRFVATSDWDIDQAVLHGCSGALIEQAAEGFANDQPELSAKTGWALWQRVVPLSVVLGLLISAVVYFPAAAILIIATINVCFTFGILFKVVVCLAGARKLGQIEDEELKRTIYGASPQQPEVTRIEDKDLPVYTLLIPVYNEANVVDKIIDHLGALDYPKSKLQVLLLMEADDAATIEAAKNSRPPEYVRFVVVPSGGPQTKPKACNVGLSLAVGKYLVIYDAEDRPEPGQLREVVARFEESPPNTVCLQARLNYFNARQNILTRLFTLEYSFWFDYMLPGLDALRLPIPLGGTSNHFLTESLRMLGAWDPYNVTEDADLGVRATAAKQHIGITESTTWEEACSEWRSWVRQRTRWIKGYMVTALVHTRSWKRLWKTGGWRGTLGVTALIAGTPLTFLATPIIWAISLYSLLLNNLGGFRLSGFALIFTTINLIVGNLMMIGLSAAAARRRKLWHLAAYALLNPVYWLLHSVAAYRALWQLIFDPSTWEKTPHGITHGPPSAAEPVVESM